MAEMAQRKGRGSIVRTALWSLAALLLLAPVVAMRFTDEVNWTASDFLFAGIVFGTIGLVAELIVRRSGSVAYRAAAGFALAAAFVIVWANGAVGMIGDEGNAYNLWFYAAILVALAGALAARMRASGMALATLAAGIVQVGVALGGLSADPQGAWISAAFASLWLVSAALFLSADRERVR
ncbi:MAG TPA: hypothetical protein VHM92_12690 [Allosphingosinicella sp.]|nr:hypothetical protein [Allosphingosinicella sp.]